MSDHKFQQELDRPAIGVSVIVLLSALVIFAIGVGIFAWIQKHDTGSVVSGAGNKATEVGKPEVGIVNQPLFDVDTRTTDRLSAQKKRLSGYGWVDRKSGVIHIPIERAMEMVAAEGGK